MSTSFSLILFKALVLLTFSFLIVEVLYFRVRNNLKAHVGDVDAAAVPCGFGRAIGNKVSLY